MIFTISEANYLARDPAVYGTDVLVREMRKKVYLDAHPKDRQVPREVFRANFALWCTEIEGSLTEAVVLLKAILIPQDGAPEITEELIVNSPTYEVEEVLGFFSEERTKAYLAYASRKKSGETTNQTPTETTST